MKYIFIVNGHAGNEKQISFLSSQIKNLKTPIEYKIYQTQAKKDATRFVKETCKNNPDEEICFVACGGDGTLNEVSSGLVHEENKYLGLLALGSGNDFRKYYKDKDFQSVEKLVNGTKTRIDIMKTNDSYSINVANIGFDAMVGAVANKLKEKGHKHNPYTKGIIKALFVGRFHKMQIIVDGKNIAKKYTLLCTFSNNSHVGGRYMCAPRSNNQDGLIEICYFRSLPLLNFILMQKTYEKGKHLDTPKFYRFMQYYQSNHVSIICKKVQDLCIDGEIIRSDKFEIDMLNKAVNFIIPE